MALELPLQVDKSLSAMSGLIIYQSSVAQQHITWFEYLK